MFSKLLKHELRATGRVMPFIYIATAFLLLVSYILHRLELGAVSNITLAVSLLGAVAMIVVTLVTIVMRYYKSMFGAEGFLTNTLPVKAGPLVLSKALVSIFWYVISYAFCIGAVAFVVYLFGGFEKGITDIIQNSMGIKISALISFAVFFGAVYLIESVYFIAQVLFSVTLANCGPFQSQPVAMSFVIYIVL